MKFGIPCDDDGDNDKKERKKENEVTQSCLTLCDSMDYSPPCSSVPGILQARILEWVATFSSRGFSQPRDPNSSLLDWQVDALTVSHLGSPFSEPE